MESEVMTKMKIKNVIPKSNHQSILSCQPAPSKRMSLSKGFTIIEVLVVIVVIGIIASIVAVSYNGVQAKARDNSVQADIDTIDTLQTNYGLSHNGSGKAYYSGNGYDSELGFAPTTGNVIDVVVNSTDYCIRGYNVKGTKNSISNAFIKESSTGMCGTLSASAAAIADSPTVPAGCPTNFIPVPGSATYGTSDFCVMKYEAKDAGGNVPVSTAAGTPFVSVTQANAIAYSANVAGCTGCHLITEAEWLTIAQNVLNVASNWDNGAGVHAVGTGYIYSGHSANNPNNALAADTNDSNGYFGETSPPIKQRRTLTLSNGEVIWDMAGNLWEWTSGTSTTGQPGVSGGGYNWREWTAVTNPGTISPNPSPATTGIPGASSWNSSNGIGKLYSNADEVALRGFQRGGNWLMGSQVGILYLNLTEAPSVSYTDLGFRVAR